MARVTRMLADRAWTGVVVVSLPEELAAEETRALVPRVTQSLGRPPLAVIVNRSASGLVSGAGSPAWLTALEGRLPPPVFAGIVRSQEQLFRRIDFERALARDVAPAAERGVVAWDEQLAQGVERSPKAIALALASGAERTLAGRA
jgi:hypothetical protein